MKKIKLLTLLLVSLLTVIVFAGDDVVFPDGDDDVVFPGNGNVIMSKKLVLMFSDITIMDKRVTLDYYHHHKDDTNHVKIGFLITMRAFNYYCESPAMKYSSSVFKKPFEAHRFDCFAIGNKLPGIRFKNGELLFLDKAGFIVKRVGVRSRPSDET